MKVIVDTCVWSLALRRGAGTDQAGVLEALRRFIIGHRVQMIGPIRQELLSGIRSRSQFETLRMHLDSFPDLPILTEDYVAAAQYFNTCRARGIQGSSIDFLICAVAVRTGFAIYTTDNDFRLFAEHLPISLH